jgi:hypothetical protein
MISTQPLGSSSPPLRGKELQGAGLQLATKASQELLMKANLTASPDRCRIIRLSEKAQDADLILKENRMAYTLDTKVGEILKDTHAVEILERHAPGVSKNPMIGLAKGMTLKSVVSMPQARQAGLTEEMVVKVLAEINARK